MLSWGQLDQFFHPHTAVAHGLDAGPFPKGRFLLDREVGDGPSQLVHDPDQRVPGARGLAIMPAVGPPIGAPGMVESRPRCDLGCHVKQLTQPPMPYLDVRDEGGQQRLAFTDAPGDAL
jgi:hypothetical protein